jgi:signal transduction histidine kinase
MRLRPRLARPRLLLDPAGIFFGSLALVSLVLVAVLVTSIVSAGRINASSKRTFVRQALPVTAHVRGLQLALLNEETSVRGYIVTGDPRNLEPYRLGRRQASADLAALERFARTHTEFGPLLQRARREIAAVDRYFQSEISLVREFGYTGQLRAQLKVDRGRVLFSRFRATAGAIEAETAAFVRQAERDQDRTYRLSVIALAGLGVFGLVLSMGMLVVGPSRVRRLYSELERGARASLALDHVGDAVTLVVADDRVLYENESARSMFGAGGPFPSFRALRSRLEAATAVVGHELTVPVEASDGTERWLSIAAVPFDDGVVYRLRDVTEDHKLEQLRSDFVATASHELRTPVAAVYGAAETLRQRRGQLDVRTQSRLLDMIASESSNLAEIVDQILLTNELDAHIVTIARRPVDPVELAGGVVEAAASRAPENVSISLEADPQDSGPVVTDETRLRQILVNLVENAVKYSPGGGTVKVGVRRAPDRISFEVRDQGMGIAPEDRERIFEKFYRADPSMSRGVGGTGLGLYIVNELVSRLGGSIEVSSTPGSGSSFRVDFPVETPPR